MGFKHTELQGKLIFYNLNKSMIVDKLKNEQKLSEENIHDEMNMLAPYKHLRMK